MEHGFFHPSVGYWQTNNTPSQEVLNTYPEGTIEVSLQPAEFYTFDGSGWVPPSQEDTNARFSILVREQRDALLADNVDPLVSNPLRWADLTAEQQQAWKDYRHALLNVPQQGGFPQDVIWPVQPS
jgi:hypothetical protein